MLSRRTIILGAACAAQEDVRALGKQWSG